MAYTKYLFVLFLSLFIVTGCGKKAVKETPPKQTETTPEVVVEMQKPKPESTHPEISYPEVVETKPAPAPVQIPETPAPTVTAQIPQNIGPQLHKYPRLTPTNWDAVDGFFNDDLTQTWQAWLYSCEKLQLKAEWSQVCSLAFQISNPTQTTLVDYFINHFNVYRASNQNGTSKGTVTGYYEPLLKGSYNKSAQYPYPLYREPSDLISVDLTGLFPELKFKRVRGRLVGNKLEPYYSRAEIEAANKPLAGNEIVYVNDIIDAFFLQIQGSGVVQLDNGQQLHLGYANQNGHPYRSLGKALVRDKEMKLSDASMQGIKDWARSNPHKLREYLNRNPSYVFFRKLPDGLTGPLGSLAVPLTAKRSVAVDPKYIPLGAPLFLSTTYPGTNTPLRQLMQAQDTGGAIKNGVRADFYWGSGDAAGNMAGKMKQSGKVWVLLPKNF